MWWWTQAIQLLIMWWKVQVMKLFIAWWGVKIMKFRTVQFSPSSYSVSLSAHV
jgi:hypothetical protein